MWTCLRMVFFHGVLDSLCCLVNASYTHAFVVIRSPSPAAYHISGPCSLFFTIIVCSGTLVIPPLLLQNSSWQHTWGSQIHGGRGGITGTLDCC